MKTYIKYFSVFIVLSCICYVGIVFSEDPEYVGCWGIYTYDSQEPYTLFSFVLRDGYLYEAYCQDFDFCNEKYGVETIIETGEYSASGDTITIKVKESNIPDRKDLTFKISYQWYSINHYSMIFTNARLLTFEYVDSDTVALEMVRTGVKNKKTSWAEIKVLLKDK